jgi:hypothetical protein
MPIFGSIPADLPRLPEAPWFERAVLTEPLPTALLVAGLAVAGAVVVGGVVRAAPAPSRALRRLPLAVALIGLILALGVFAAGRLVTTPAEALAQQARQLVTLAAEGQADPIAPMLAANVAVEVKRSTYARTPAELLSLVRGLPTGPSRLREFSILDARAVIDSPTAARTQVGLQVVPESTDFPVGSWWLLHWQRDGEAAPWRLRLIEAQHIDGLR